MATKTTASKASKSTAKTSAKSAAKKPAVKKEQTVYIQFYGKEVNTKDVIDRIKAIWTKEMGRKVGDLADLKVYIKPEENMAHYVINGDIIGSIEM